MNDRVQWLQSEALRRTGLAELCRVQERIVIELIVIIVLLVFTYSSIVPFEFALHVAFLTYSQPVTLSHVVS